ncbi:peptidoglycan-binding protein [Gracilibacillus alcaliphilus]|uniref:peptidoglycan-binding protein n=1 Tax=Gracilibacillus alcaliphilus TaxID=1401441 RepID=UPI00195A1240|nr:peptidoglycan-binding protein [Gracilibacillus alcaliphilus]MBM7677687.1 peptidoglycan L-alanyl-D-glutamate endopeptidase CwlK [Gracilibacillus alcaliphilus]
MTVSLDTLLERSNRNMGTDIEPAVKQAGLEVIRRAYAEGIFAQITEGYRNNSRQQALYDQGRTTPGNIVTHARAGQSYHNYGLAIDYVLVSRDGKKAVWEVSKDWRRVASIAKGLGFEWGGDWKGFKDYPHLQMTGGLTLAQLQAGKRPFFSHKPKPAGTGKNDVIAMIQQTLNDRYAFHIKVDNQFGPETSKALLKAYQTELNQQFEAGLAVDGIWGAKTQAASVTVRQGAKGQLTWILQALLYAKGYDPQGIDGIFGKRTTAQVRAFQKDHHLSVDGLAGKQTFRSLFQG